MPYNGYRGMNGAPFDVRGNIARTMMNIGSPPPQVMGGMLARSPMMGGSAGPVMPPQPAVTPPVTPQVMPGQAPQTPPPMPGAAPPMPGQAPQAPPQAPLTTPFRQPY